MLGGGVGYGASDGGAAVQDGKEKLGKFDLSRRPIRSCVEAVAVCACVCVCVVLCVS